jgi:hypothetical protein
MVGDRELAPERIEEACRTNHLAHSILTLSFLSKINGSDMSSTDYSDLRL